MSTRIAVLGLALAACTAASGQTRFVVGDRTSDAMWLLTDVNGNGVIDEPGEVNLFFDVTNAAGTITTANPTALAIHADGRVLVGDQTSRSLILLRDLNADGDAQDAGESLVCADATNASGISFAFPCGFAFDSGGFAFAVNAGNSYGDDGVYRLEDLNADGDFQDAGEITVYVGDGVFIGGNDPAYSPQEILFDAGDVGFLRNSRSSSSLEAGVFRFEDIDANGRADDPGEFTPYFDANNASGIAPSAGFPLAWDPVRMGAMYTLQVLAGADQLIRLTDLNCDDDAQDAGEAVLTYSTDESGFSSNDLICMNDGRVLISDLSSDRIIMLTDMDGDGLFMTPGERADFFANSMMLIADVRKSAEYPVAGCPGNLDGDGDTDLADLGILLADFGCTGCNCPGDLDGDGDTDLADLGILLADFGCTP